MKKAFRVVGGVFAVLVLLVAAPDSFASATMDEVIAPVRQLSSCRPVEGEAPPVSLQAGMFFHYDTEKEASLRPVAKRYESFRCGKHSATIYLYEYRDERAAREALSHATVLIWGKDKPSRKHPEAVFAVDNVLVVVSTRDPRELVDAILSRSSSNGKRE